MFDKTLSAPHDDEVAIWKNLTLSSLARSATLMQTTFEQGPPAVLAQEFSDVVDRLHEIYATTGDVDAFTLLKCSKLASDLKTYSFGISLENFRKDLATL